MASKKTKRPQHDKSSTNNQDARREESTNRHVYVHPGAQIDFVQDIRNKYDADQAENKTHNQQILFWSKISTVLIFIYAALTFWQSCSNHTASQAAKSAAETASNTLKGSRSLQRPYIISNPMRAGEPVGEGHANSIFVRSENGYKVYIAVNIMNTGTSLAVNTIPTSSHIIVGPNDEAFREAMSFVPRYPAIVGGIIPPQTAIEGPSQMVASEVKEITADQLSMIRERKWGLYVVGGIQYWDVFEPKLETPYTTQYCYHYQTWGLPFGICEFGNLIK